MQNKNLEQIRTVIKMFFNEYDMEDIYNYIDNNISMNEIKIISNKNRIKFSIRERLEYSFVTDISLEQQIQNFRVFKYCKQNFGKSKECHRSL